MTRYIHVVNGPTPNALGKRERLEQAESAIACPIEEG